jgi:hypothetical protein
MQKQIPHPRKTPFAVFAQGKRVWDDNFHEIIVNPDGRLTVHHPGSSITSKAGTFCVEVRINQQ